MNTKRLFVILLIGTMFWTSACSSGHSAETSTNTEPVKSELASLMRVMEKHGDEVRKALKNDLELPDRPLGIEGLLLAQPTPRLHIEQQTFPVFAEEYLKSIDALYVAKSAHRHEDYNAIIQSCSNCHTVNCPGPLMKIDKMFLDKNR